MQQHTEIMLRLARERQQRYQDEAQRDEFVRQQTSIQRQEPRERFRVTDLRWVLFRPVGA
jgi:hypothetical protein